MLDSLLQMMHVAVVFSKIVDSCRCSRILTWCLNTFINHRMFNYTTFSIHRYIRCIGVRSWCRNAKGPENQTLTNPASIFSILETFLLHFWHLMSPLHTFVLYAHSSPPFYITNKKVLINAVNFKKEKECPQMELNQGTKIHVWHRRGFNLLSYPEFKHFVNIHHYVRNQCLNFLSIFGQNSTPGPRCS